MRPVPDAPLASLPDESSFDELSDADSGHARTDSREMIDAGEPIALGTYYRWTEGRQQQPH